MDKAYEKITWEIIKLLWKIIKNSLVILYEITKLTIKELLDFKALGNKKLKIFAYSITSIIIIILVVDVKYFYFGFLTYFVVTAAYKWSIEKIGKIKVKFKIKKNNNKYKNLISYFDNKIAVIEVTVKHAIIFSSDLTLSELRSTRSIERMEMYFNRDISTIFRRNDFQYYTVSFSIDTSFMKYYFFDRYIRFISISTIKQMCLPVIIGVDESGKYIVKDLTKLMHLFVAGESGGGKSVLLNVMIQSLMVFRNNIVYVLIDFKKGVEMSDYIYFNNTVIVKDMESFKTTIAYIKKIMNDRLDLVTKTPKCKNIQQYNAKPNTKDMSYIVIVIDEISLIKLKNGDSKKQTEEEKDLLIVLQQGRCVGVHCIGATQRNSAGQLNTDVRAGFQTAISGKITRKETQKMTKVLGTENLDKGEFKTDFMEGIYKGFYVSDEETREDPESNGVYETLDLYLIQNKDIIEVKSKEHRTLIEKYLIRKRQLKILAFYRKYLKRNVKSKEPLLFYEKYIKPSSNDVVSIVKDMKRLCKIDDLSAEKPQINNGVHNSIIDEELEKLLKYIFRNYNKENNNLPAAADIEKYMKIDKGSRKRNNLLVKLYDLGFLYKITPRSTKYKVNILKKEWKYYNS